MCRKVTCLEHTVKIELTSQSKLINRDKRAITPRRGGQLILGYHMHNVSADVPSVIQEESVVALRRFLGILYQTHYSV